MINIGEDTSNLIFYVVILTSQYNDVDNRVVTFFFIESDDN